MKTSGPLDLFDRLPPQDLDAEQSVLGSILLDQNQLDEVALMLVPDDFYRPSHRTIYATMLELRGAGKGVDHGLVISTLKKRGAMEEAGGLTYIGEVADSVPTPANAVWYAEHVRDCAMLRAMIHAGSEMIHEAHHGDGEARERIAKAETKVMELLERGVTRNVRAIQDVLHDALAEIDERVKRSTVSGLSTGYPQLDQMMGGMRPGELIVVAARPSRYRKSTALASETGCLIVMK
jgi:replicative DNA helicase